MAWHAKQKAAWERLMRAMRTIDLSGVDGPLAHFIADDLSDGYVTLTHRSGQPVLRVNEATFQQRLLDEVRRKGVTGDDLPDLTLRVLEGLLPDLCIGCGQYLGVGSGGCEPCRSRQIDDLLDMADLDAGASLAETSGTIVSTTAREVP